MKKMSFNFPLAILQMLTCKRALRLTPVMRLQLLVAVFSLLAESWQDETAEREQQELVKIENNFTQVFFLCSSVAAVIGLR